MTTSYKHPPSYCGAILASLLLMSSLLTCIMGRNVSPLSTLWGVRSPSLSPTSISTLPTTVSSELLGESSMKKKKKKKRKKEHSVASTMDNDDDEDDIRLEVEQEEDDGRRDSEAASVTLPVKKVQKTQVTTTTTAIRKQVTTKTAIHNQPPFSLPRPGRNGYKDVVTPLQTRTERPTLAHNNRRSIKGETRSRPLSNPIPKDVDLPLGKDSSKDENVSNIHTKQPRHKHKRRRRVSSGSDDTTLNISMTTNNSNDHEHGDTVETLSEVHSIVPDDTHPARKHMPEHTHDALETPLELPTVHVPLEETDLTLEGTSTRHLKKRKKKRRVHAASEPMAEDLSLALDVSSSPPETHPVMNTEASTSSMHKKRHKVKKHKPVGIQSEVELASVEGLQSTSETTTEKVVLLPTTTMTVAVDAPKKKRKVKRKSVGMSSESEPVREVDTKPLSEAQLEEVVDGTAPPPITTVHNAQKKHTIKRKRVGIPPESEPVRVEEPEFVIEDALEEVLPTTTTVPVDTSKRKHKRKRKVSVLNAIPTTDTDDVASSIHVESLLAKNEPNTIPADDDSRTMDEPAKKKHKKKKKHRTIPSPMLSASDTETNGEEVVPVDPTSTADVMNLESVQTITTLPTSGQPELSLKKKVKKMKKRKLSRSHNQSAVDDMEASDSTIYQNTTASKVNQIDESFQSTGTPVDSIEPVTDSRADAPLSWEIDALGEAQPMGSSESNIPSSFNSTLITLSPSDVVNETSIESRADMSTDSLPNQTLEDSSTVADSMVPPMAVENTSQSMKWDGVEENIYPLSMAISEEGVKLVDAVEIVDGTSMNLLKSESTEAEEEHDADSDASTDELVQDIMYDTTLSKREYDTTQTDDLYDTIPKSDESDAEDMDDVTEQAVTEMSESTEADLMAAIASSIPHISSMVHDARIDNLTCSVKYDYQDTSLHDTDVPTSDNANMSIEDSEVKIDIVEEPNPAMTSAPLSRNSSVDISNDDMLDNPSEADHDTESSNETTDDDEEEEEKDTKESTEINVITSADENVMHDNESAGIKSSEHATLQRNIMVFKSPVIVDDDDDDIDNDETSSEDITDEEDNVASQTDKSISRGKTLAHNEVKRATQIADVDNDEIHYPIAEEVVDDDGDINEDANINTKDSSVYKSDEVVKDEENVQSDETTTITVNTTVSEVTIERVDPREDTRTHTQRNDTSISRDAVAEKLSGLASIEDRKDDLTVSVITWNLAEDSPSESESSFLRKFRQSKKNAGSDIVLISSQECENIKPRRSEGHRSREFRRLMIKMMGKDYVPIALHLLGGIQFGLFCKRSILSDVEHASIADVTCGIGNVFHNKGAIGAFIQMKARNDDDNVHKRDSSIRMLFVSAHMAAHVKNADARDADFWRIVTELEAQAPTRFLRSDQNHPEHVSALIEFVDRVFFCGDLNYRLDIAREDAEYILREIDEVSSKSKAHRDNDKLASMRLSLLRHDQLRSSMAERRAFVGLTEGRITFMPTFKYDKGSSEYDTSHKQRIPAWTDRVLYKPVGTRILQYSSVPDANHSDHRPVYATFRVNRQGRLLPPKVASTKKRRRSTNSIKK
jgi:hypothetical protein